MIGTRAATAHTSQIRDSDPGRKTAVGMLVLALLVGWFGYRALTNSSAEVPPPSELAFTTTTIRPTTTTTEPPARQWTEHEVLGKFASVFVTVELHECPAEPTEKGESSDRWTTPGVLVDENNVVFDGAEIGTASIAIIRSRIGTETEARITLQGGTGVATTPSRSTRNLALVEQPEGEAAFSVHRDSESNAIIVQPLSSAVTARPSVTVSGQGEALAVDTGGSPVDLPTLLDISELESAVLPDQKPVGLCGRAAVLVDSELAASLVEADED